MAGLDRESLKLKVGILDRLWKNVVEFVRNTGTWFMDFTNKDLVTLVRKFLSYLNSFLESVKLVFPGVEAMKEFKDMLEGLFDLTEVLKCPSV
jgi:hypothetical protein